MTHLRGYFGPTYSKVIATAVMLLLLLAVGCGAAATATPAPGATAAPAPATGATARPTAMPQATAVPAAPVVNPGKVTWMVGNWGNERFDYTFTSAGGQEYARQIHAFLISSDVKNGRREIIPGVATKWEVSSDGLTWTYTIRKGVKFHNGTEVTAEDVLWTLRHTVGPQAKEYASGGSSITYSNIMDRIEQAGPDQVSLTTKTPSSDVPTDISEASGHFVGVVIPKRATLHNVEEEAAYDRNPIGAGIMKLVKHVPASQMSFERFADFYYQPKNGLPTDKRVNFTTLDLRLVPEEATRVAAIRAGEADIAPISLATRKQVEAGGGRLVFGQEGVYFAPRIMGCWKPELPCSKKGVRQALSYAIDKKIIQNQLYGGPEIMQVKGWAAVTPSTLGYSPELDPFPYDPNKARQLLADAGYPGGKGFGKMVINTWTSSALPLMPESAQLVADFWKKDLGLEVEVRVGDRAALDKGTQSTEDYFGQVLWRENETRVDAAGTVLRSRYGTPPANKKDVAHDDPRLFELSKNARAVFDPVAREKILNSTYLQLRDEAIDIGIGYVNIPWGVGPRVQTWEPYPLAFYPSALHTIVLK